MKNSTEKLIERLGLQDELTKEMIEGIISAIERLEKWKFPTGVHTIYVDAIRDLTDNDPVWILVAKKACNERALTPVYEV